MAVAEDDLYPYLCNRRQSMPFDLNRNNDGIIFNFHGSINTDEVNKANDVLHKDTRLKNHKYSIFNFLDTHSDTIDNVCVMFSADMSIKTVHVKHKMRIAFVVADKYAKALCLYYIELSKDVGSTWEFDIFNSVEEALNWVR